MFLFRSAKLALVVRTDLSMKKGKIASQCCHAAVACYRLAKVQAPKLLSQWERSGEAKVVLRCGSEEDLLALHVAALDKGLCAVLVRDAGRTQVDFGTVTALGIGPADDTSISELLGHLKLL